MLAHASAEGDVKRCSDKRECCERKCIRKKLLVSQRFLLAAHCLGFPCPPALKIIVGELKVMADPKRRAETASFMVLESRETA